MARAGWLSFLAIALTFVAGHGCRPSLPAPEDRSTSPAGSDDLSRDYQPTTTGTIHGVVRWEGELPAVAPLTINVPGSPRRTERNPNEPRINASERTVGGAVVFLKKVDPRRARPWDFPPVRIVLEDKTLRVLQGGVTVPVAFVRPGQEIEWESCAETFGALRARGAAFFTLPFVKPGVNRRSMPREGHVEVSSGSGAFWLRGHLFVCSHPYVCLTNEKGEFTLEQVPAGSYEIHCWLPNWEIERVERDVEIREPARLYFRPSWEASRNVEVSTNTRVAADLSLGR